MCVDCHKQNKQKKFWMTQLKGTFHCLSNAGVEQNGQIQAAEAQIHTSLVTIQGQIHKPTFP